MIQFWPVRQSARRKNGDAVFNLAVKHLLTYLHAGLEHARHAGVINYNCPGDDLYFFVSRALFRSDLQPKPGHHLPSRVLRINYLQHRQASPIFQQDTL